MRGEKEKQGERGEKGGFCATPFFFLRSNSRSVDTFRRTVILSLIGFHPKFRAVSRRRWHYSFVLTAAIRLCPLLSREQWTQSRMPLKLRMASIVACATTTQIFWTRSRIYDLNYSGIDRDDSLTGTVQFLSIDKTIFLVSFFLSFSLLQIEKNKKSLALNSINWARMYNINVSNIFEAWSRHR